jgi:glycosyltransferase involved in cell wall biosynthesis
MVGRKDLNLAQADTEIAKALKARSIILLGDLPDQAVAHLYRTCLFTVFPSLCEGYGLPIAESLGFGKLCLSADLPTIREHAGELPWYFQPDKEHAMYDCLRRAIERPDLRLRAETQIKENYRPCSWTQTFISMVESINRSRDQIL